MITKFERYNDDDWKVGDIIVAIGTKYDYGGRWIKEGEKYIITNIEDNSHNKNLKDRIKVKGLNDRKHFSYYYKYNFISLAEHDAKKYNL